MSFSDDSAVLPSPRVLLCDTEWATLDHALGAAGDTPDALDRLLAEDPTVVNKALRHLEQTVHHQNTIYSATVPSALYLAAILSERQTEAKGIYRLNDSVRPLRAVLLDWLSELADDVSDAAVAAMRRHGFNPLEDDPEMVQLRAVRPLLYRAVIQFVNDADVSIRCPAVIAASLLLDNASQIRVAGLIPRIREVAAIASDRRYSLRATQLLAVHIDPQGLLSDENVPF